MMKSTHDLLGRLRNLMPAGVQPKFTSSQELMAWQQEEGRKRAAELEKQNQRNRSERIFGRSGICELHRGVLICKLPGEQRRAETRADDGKELRP